MKIKVVIVLVLGLTFLNCKTGARVINPEDLEEVNAVVKMDTITIESNFANPQNATLIANTGLLPLGNNSGNISLMGNTNYFKIIGKTLSADLPYYGERQMGGGYNTENVGIAFNGDPSVFEHSFNSKKGTHDYYFEISKDSEAFQIRLNIFPSLKTTISITSNQRTFISYTGKVLHTP
ncbi:DUF4251 domain-containing protein [Seonamhaeicola marinus]|uniref:DUF4251 domain-containing protein n=1 Tax=Seonamhaeicola marinus TaxID=1912246 RepID=A0A5D0HRC3_9FLAO|nr:DUF4251 domain-containing protein [Seonamhaeicola marinus]TYA71932.1 DUF4251 domain-containing protein [Seonamhaeicola marinus]